MPTIYKGTIKDENGNPLYPATSADKVSGLATVATSGSYTDLSNKPTIPDISGKLDKLTYEWNKSVAMGSSGYVKIGSFPMYDSNITIDIDSTTSLTYHGTVVIATQNTSTSSMGSAHKVEVYGDPSGNIASSIRVVWTSGSRNYDVYFVPQPWSKNLIHIRAVALSSTASDVCISQTGTAPTSTSGLEAVNKLSTVAGSGSYNDLTNKPIVAIVTITTDSGTLSDSDYNKLLEKDAIICYEDSISNSNYYFQKSNETSNNNRMWFYRIDVTEGSVTYDSTYIEEIMVKSDKTYTYSYRPIKIGLDNIDSGTATSGQTLTADGSGGASWQSVTTGVSSIGGKTGAITLSGGLSIDSNNVLNSTGAVIVDLGTLTSLTKTITSGNLTSIQSSDNVIVKYVYNSKTYLVRKISEDSTYIYFSSDSGIARENVSSDWYFGLSVAKLTISNRSFVLSVKNKTDFVIGGGTGLTYDVNSSKIIVDTSVIAQQTDLANYIPLSGSNAITGSLIPNTTNSIDLGASSKLWKDIYHKGNSFAIKDALGYNGFIVRNTAYTLGSNGSGSSSTQGLGGYCIQENTPDWLSVVETRLMDYKSGAIPITNLHLGVRQATSSAKTDYKYAFFDLQTSNSYSWISADCQDFRPTTSGSTKLGENSHRWGDAYLNNNLYLGDSNSGSKAIYFQKYSNNAFYNAAGIVFYAPGPDIIQTVDGHHWRNSADSSAHGLFFDANNGYLYPETHDGVTLGHSSKRFTQLYLTGVQLKYNSNTQALDFTF